VVAPSGEVEGCLTAEHSSDYLSALRDLLCSLEEIEASSMIIGGLAVIASGVARSTLDIDATIAGPDTTPEEILAAFGRHGIQPRLENTLEFARFRQIVLALHEETGISIDLSLAWLPFEAEALRSRRFLSYRGLTLPLPRPEDLLIYKLVAHRPRDVEDAERILTLHRSEISPDRVRSWLDQFSSALEDDSRSRTFEGLLRRLEPPG
jgi:hypothetical protein